MARCWTYSHSPTPPACGQIGMPNWVDSSMIESTSFTPPTRQLSTWQKPMAPACRSCLKMTRFWQASPVATPIGATALAIFA